MGTTVLGCRGSYENGEVLLERGMRYRNDRGITMGYLDMAERAIKRLKTNQPLVEEYFKSLQGRASKKTGESLTPKTILNYVAMLAKPLNDIGAFETWSLQKLEEYWAHSEDFNITKNSPYRRAVAQFLTWMIERSTDRDEAERLARLMQTVRNIRLVRRNLSVDDLLTPDDVEMLIASAKRSVAPVRNACLVAFLWETGMRPSELRQLNYEDVQLENGYAKIFVRESKTERRVIALAEGLPYLKEWLNAHPKKEKGSPLFTSLNRKNLHARFGERALGDILKPIAHSANLPLRTPIANSRRGVNQKIHRGITPYLFRHSRITYLLNKARMNILDVARMCGTSVGMIERTYGKWMEQDTLVPYLQAVGIIKEDITELQQLAILECPKCKATLPPSLVICTECDYIIDDTLREKEQTKIERIVDARIEEMTIPMYTLKEMLKLMKEKSGQELVDYLEEIEAE